MNVFKHYKYKPMKLKALNDFAQTCKNKGFTEERKTRMFEAIWPFCTNVMLLYARKYNTAIEQFAGASWLAIEKAVKNYDPAQGGAFTTVLINWMQHQINEIVYSEILHQKYHNDKYKAQLVSIDAANDQGFSILDTIKDENQQLEAEQKKARFTLDHLKQKSMLDDTEERIIKICFGCNDSQTSYNGRENAVQFFGRSNEWVRKKKLKVLQKLRTTKTRLEATA